MLSDIVFVYGTLRRGEVNHALLRRARFLGEHRTSPAFTMFDLGPYPGVVGVGDDTIRGELYGVDPATLERLDELEDYPVLYDRERIPSPAGAAWIYLYRGAAQRWPVVAGGDWLARGA